MHGDCFYIWRMEWCNALGTPNNTCAEDFCALLFAYLCALPIWLELVFSNEGLQTAKW